MTHSTSKNSIYFLASMLTIGAEYLLSLLFTFHFPFQLGILLLIFIFLGSVLFQQGKPAGLISKKPRFYESILLLGVVLFSLMVLLFQLLKGQSNFFSVTILTSEKFRASQIDTSLCNSCLEYQLISKSRYNNLGSFILDFGDVKGFDPSQVVIEIRDNSGAAVFTGTHFSSTADKLIEVGVPLQTLSKDQYYTTIVRFPSTFPDVQNVYLKQTKYLFPISSIFDESNLSDFISHKLRIIDLTAVTNEIFILTFVSVSSVVIGTFTYGTSSLFYFFVQMLFVSFVFYLQRQISGHLIGFREIFFFSSAFIASLFLVPYFWKRARQSREKNDQTLPRFFNILFFGVIFLMYVFQLGNYGFQMDEYYHAGVVKTYAETGNMFYIGDTPYNRSKLTSLIAIGVFEFSEVMHFPFNQEFILRLPIVLFGLGSLVMVLKITQLLGMPQKIAYLVTAVLATEIYFYYFSIYLRFYMIGVFFILFPLYFVLKNQKIKFDVLAFLVSVGCYYFLSEFFLSLMILYAVIVGLRYYTNVYSRKPDLRKSFILGAIGLSILLYVLYQINLRSRLTGSYNFVEWNFNREQLNFYLIFLIQNFGIYLLTLPISFVLLLKKMIRFFRDGADLPVVELIVFALLAFFLGYVVHVPFNFTFRPLIFVIPILILLFAVVLYQLLETKITTVLLTILVLINTGAYLRYRLSAVGDMYHPTKLVYEKMEIITGNKDIAHFIDINFTDEPFSLFYVGLANYHLRYYLSTSEERDFYSYRSTRNGSSSVLDFQNDLMNSDHSEKLIVINANAIDDSSRNNQLWNLLYGRVNVTETDPKIYRYISSNAQFELIYESIDGVSKVFRYDEIN